MNKDLIVYVKNSILPEYKKFDKAHNEEHVKAVIKRSFQIAISQKEDLNNDLIFAIAAYHDIGIMVARKNHNIHSANIVRNDKNLEKFFSDDEIEIIAQAVEDHSTHLRRCPRSIYGQIVADADKDTDIEHALGRTWQFAKKYFPNYSQEQMIENVYDDLCKRYGHNGSVQFWLSTQSTDCYFQAMRNLAINKDLFNEKIKEIIDKDLDR